jgi:hypothetical protein
VIQHYLTVEVQVSEQKEEIEKEIKDLGESFDALHRYIREQDWYKAGGAGLQIIARTSHLCACLFEMASIIESAKALEDGE